MKKPNVEKLKPIEDGKSDAELERIYLQLKGESNAALDPEAVGGKQVLELIDRVREREQDETVKHGQTLIDGVFSTPIAKDSFPEFIGRFKIKNVLGTGGFGIVFLAEDPNLGRDVALKIPRPEAILTPELKARFVREGKSAASLAHPGIVPVYESGQVGARCYLASEFIDGTTLAEFIQLSDGPDCGSAAKITAAIADAISHAHQRKVLHRDIKPANILIANDSESGSIEDRIRVADFGLAKIESENSLQTQSGALVGTPAYMSPEQASQQPASSASDIYSIGAVLYELMTGQPPVNESNLLAAIQAVLTKDPMPPRRINPQVPRDLEAICLKCLNKNPLDRYASAFELNADLHRFLQGQPVIARPIPQVEYVRRWFSRNPLLATACSLALLTTVALIVGLSVGLYLLSEANRKSDNLLTRSNRAVFDSKISEARAQRRSQDSKSQEHSRSALLEAIELMDRVEITANDALDLRSELAISLASYIPMTKRSWPAAAIVNRKFKFDFSPDLKSFAVSTAGKVVVRSTQDYSLIRKIEVPKNALAKPKFSPDGGFLLLEYLQFRGSYAPKPCLQVVCVDDGEVVLSLTPIWISANSFSHDSSELFCADRGSQTVRRFSLRTKAELAPLELPSVFYSNLTPGPNGEFVAYVCQDGTQKSERGCRLVVIGLDSGQLAFQSPRYRNYIADLFWSEQGKRLGYIQTTNIRFLRLIESKRKFVSDVYASITHRGDTTPSLGISPCGVICMVTYSDNTTEFYDRISKRLIFKVQGNGIRFGVNEDVGFASMGKPVEVWKIRRPVGYQCVKDRPFGVDGVTLDGRNIYSSGLADKRIYLRTLDSINRNTHRSIVEQSQSVVVTKTGDIYTCGSGGMISRWRWFIGKPQPGKLPLSGYQRTEIHASRRLDGTICKSGDGKKLGYQISKDFILFDIESETKKSTGLKFIGPWHSLNHDATLVAVGDESTSESKIYDTQQGKLIKTLATAIESKPQFSVDGRHLLITDINGFHWYETDTWECRFRETNEVFNDRSAKISADGNYVVVTSLQFIDVYKTDPMRIFVRLEMPTATTPKCVALSDDGETIVVGDAAGLLHLWDMSELKKNAEKLVDQWNFIGP